MRNLEGKVRHELSAIGGHLLSTDDCQLINESISRLPTLQTKILEQAKVTCAKAQKYFKQITEKEKSIYELDENRYD